MARDPKKGGSTSKTRRAKKSAPRRRGAPRTKQKKSANKNGAKDAAPSARRRASAAAASRAEIARLSRELSEALAQQTASSEVLQVISSSTGDVQPVFEKLLQNATRVCGAEFGIMGLFEGDIYRRVALYNAPPAFDTAAPKEYRPEPEGPIGRLLRTRQVGKIDDLSQSPLYFARHPAVIAMVEVAGARTLVIVPMLRNDRAIGAISIYRKEVRPFGDKQIDLLKNFANQAVIAIENARLFNETKQALERQTATADILKVIASSPDDVQPVFDAIAVQSNRLLNGLSTAVYSLMTSSI
jgi:GAF domain-containing protein